MAEHGSYEARGDEAVTDAIHGFVVVQGERQVVELLPEIHRDYDEHGHYGFADCRACGEPVEVCIQWEGEDHGFQVASSGGKVGCKHPDCSEKFPHRVRSIGRVVGKPFWEREP
jgi:hypothetical protein